jgi:hypothetical protein
VLEGRTKEDDENTHFVWYMRVVVEGREDEGDDKNALLPIPRGTTKDLLTLMAKDDQLCESSLITTYMPTNYNEQRILPKLNNWEMLPKAPKTLAIKPKPPGAGGKTKQDEREPVIEVTEDAKKKARSVLAPTKPAVTPAKPPAAKSTSAKAKPPATSSSKAEGKKPATQPSVSAGLQSKKPGNPFEKAKPPPPAAAAPKEKAPEPAPEPDSTSVDDGSFLATTQPTGIAPLSQEPQRSEGVSLMTSRTAETMEYTFNNNLGHKDAQVTFTLPDGCVTGKAVVTYKFA